MSRCCLSCSDGSVAVTGPPLCCTFLSWRTLFVAPPTGLCHVAPTFVHDSLHVTKKPTGWPLFNHCLCRTDQGGRVFARQVHTHLEMRKDFARSYLQDGHIYIYAPTSSNMGLDAGSQVLNPKWQLAGSGPSLPGATQTFPLPVCRAFMAGSPGSLSAMHYFAPSFSGRSSAEIPRRTFMEARWNCTCLPPKLSLVALLFSRVSRVQC